MKACRAILAAWLLLALAAPARAAEAYRVDPAKSSLGFAFDQAGARNAGRFGKFDVNLVLSEAEPGANRLEVVVNVPSLDTQDGERDQILRGADLFAADRYPAARFVATKLTRTGPDRYEAVGRLTIRDVTRDARIPFTLRTAAESGRRVAYMKGATVIQRLSFGVGQGEWKSTEWVGDDVEVSFSLRLVPTAPT